VQSPDAIFEYIICIGTCIFMLIFIWALCKAAKIADETMEEELRKQMDFEPKEEK
jgi:hypothetical protein